MADAVGVDAALGRVRDDSVRLPGCTQSAAQSGTLSAYETTIAQEMTDNNPVVQDFNEFGATVCGGGGSSSPSPSTSPSPSPT
jgi:hypothetical protein